MIIHFLNNSEKLPFFKFNEINIAILLEIHLIQFLNRYLGEIELIKRIIERHDYDRIIFYNLNPLYLKYFKSITLYHKNPEFYHDSQWSKILNIVSKLKLIKKIIILIIVYLRDRFIYNIDKPIVKPNKKNIIFVGNTKNQLNSIKPIYEKLKKSNLVNPIYFIEKAYLKINKIRKLISFLYCTKKFWFCSLDKILNNMKTPKTESLIKQFLEYEADYLFISLYNNYYHFTNFIKKVPPTLVSISAEHNLNIKLVAKYCKLNNIPTIYIPHAGIPLLEEVVTKREFSYITVAGKYDIDFYLKRGTPRKDIFITGAPRYEKFYNTKVRELKTVRDMFNNRKFKIDSKSTILLTTSPYDPTSIEKIITSVVSSLKELNLVDNLIIKLHPAEDGIHHKNILKKMNVNVIIVKNYALVELIKSSSLLISAVSTTILEAMIIGTPAILLEFINLGFKYIHINPFNQEKFVKAAKTQNELTFLIDQLIKNPPLRIEYSSELKRNSELFSFYDEKLPPTEKIVNLIFMIIS
jgi:UDP-N-acetylglucosamine:LPS N-acetylglucosamine transferase